MPMPIRAHARKPPRKSIPESTLPMMVGGWWWWYCHLLLLRRLGHLLRLGGIGARRGGAQLGLAVGALLVLLLALLALLLLGLFARGLGLAPLLDQLQPRQVR